MIFSAAIKDRGLNLFFVKIRLINAHLLHEYFVRQSVGQASKGRNVKIKKHDFLGLILFC